jgi:hypothetical protein
LVRGGAADAGVNIAYAASAAPKMTRFIYDPGLVHLP